MLHEILLSLSGLDSPIWSQTGPRASGPGDQERLLNQYTSPPERAMLDTLSHLHNLHVQIRRATTRLSQSHDSMVCRAVSSSIAEVHLDKFINKIFQVESALLQKDAAYVGAYEIVTLSAVVAEFAPWTRRLEWLWSVVQELDPTARHRAKARHPSGAVILNLLEKETHTGYSDIEEMAVDLLTTAQKTWMRAISLWVLYGKLPTTGAEDFCVKPNPKPASAMDAFVIDALLSPELLNRGGRDSLLSAGSALSQLHSQSGSVEASTLGFNDSSKSLLQHHLTVLGSLRYPLNPISLENALLLINNSISEKALSQILPRSLVMSLLQVIWQYMLLGQGEFAVSLISHADDRVVGRYYAQGAVQPVRRIGKLEDLTIREAELGGILSKTMAELAVLQADDDQEEETRLLAKKVLTLKAVSDQSMPLLIATILPTPTLLQLALPAHSPLHIFLSAEDAMMYANINAYLLSIHRAELHLSALWKLSSQRRCHPSPLGPPNSASQYGRARLKAGRERDARRDARTRGHWSSASKLLFLVNELQVYFQGEVIESSSMHLREWLDGKHGAYATSARSSRPGTASSAGQQGLSQLPNATSIKMPTDPRAIAEAHRTYLHAMNTALFLRNDDFLTILKDLLTQVDHLVALFSRLQTVWQGLDLQDDEGVVDAFSNYEHDEKEVLLEMDRTRHSVESALSELVAKIRDIEKEKRTGVGASSDIDNMNYMTLMGNTPKFVPWQARTVDRLVMKLDGLAVREDDEKGELVAGYDDDD